MENKFEQLDALLEKTAVYSQFLAQRLKERQEMVGKRKRTKSPGKEGAKKLKTLLEQVEGTDTDVRRVELQDSSFTQPKFVTGAQMREYQLAGVEWMVSLYENGINGILADEMGLGKTIQTIAFLAHLRGMGVPGPFLIVGPLSVVSNWRKEYKKFAPLIPTILYYGKPEERKKLRAQLRKPIDDSFPVIITTYEMVIRDSAHLSKVPWKYVVIDEAHRIKNFECKLVQVLKSYHSANRLLLTGTPLQNNLAELWSLLNFLLPEVFDDLSMFQSWFQFDVTGDVGQEALEQERERRIVSKLHNILRPFLLRRLKSDVEQILPSKKEIVLYAPLSKLQKKYYDAAMQGTLRDILAASGGNERKQSDQLLNRLMQLRKACVHPYLFEEVDEDCGCPVEETTEKLVSAASKLELVDRLLKRLLPRGHKILLFSQFTTFLDIAEDYMMLRGYEYCRIDGHTSLEDRNAQMDGFNDPWSSRSIFMLSTRAGGLGINLIGADTVIFYDSDLNPQIDLQAMDRCHRIGQTRPVHVYRLVCGGTVEESLLHRAKEKRKLERVVVTKGKFHKLRYDTNSLGVEDLEDLTRFNPVEQELGQKKAISDADLDRIVAMRPAPKDSTDSITSKVTDETSVQGDGFEVFELEMATGDSVSA